MYERMLANLCDCLEAVPGNGNGYTNIINGKTCFIFILWTIFLLAAVTSFTWQFSKLITRFCLQLQPKSVLIEPLSTLFQLPDIHFCNWRPVAVLYVEGKLHKNVQYTYLSRVVTNSFISSGIPRLFWFFHKKK